jgi:MFS family permease
LWSAQIVSAVGSRVTRTALPIIAIVSLDASPLVMAAMAILNIAPAAVVGLFLGGAIDRNDKRLMMVGADLFRFALVATITVAGLTGSLTITHLGLVAALGGAASSLFDIASHAYLPVIIGRKHLVEGNSKLSATDSAAEIVGPGLAGLLIDLLTAPIAVLLDAVSYLWSAAYLLRIQRREERHPDASSDRGFGSPLEGLRIIWRHTVLKVLLLSFGTWAFFGGFFFSLYMLYTLKTLGLSNTTVGFVISFGGVGALGGALLAQRLLEKLGPGQAITLAWAVSQLSALFIPLASVGLTVPLLILHQLLSDGFMMAAIIMSVSVRQSITPQHQLARQAGAFDFAEGAMMPLGIILSGITAEIIGVTPTVLIGVLGGLSVPVLLALSPVLRLREMPRPEATP